MNLLRRVILVLNVAAVAGAFPPGFAMAHRLNAYELVWISPFIPFWTGILCWLVITLTSKFIQADPYKNPAGIETSRRFLIVFEYVFALIFLVFISIEVLLFLHFKI